VEEINTNAPVSRPVNNVSETEDDTKGSTLPDHYENIILYNETFPIIDSEPPSRMEEPSVPAEEEPEDFNIEDILSDQSGTKHVNPLLAHIEKQMNSKHDDYKDVFSEEDEEASDSFEAEEQFEDESGFEKEEQFEDESQLENEEQFEDEEVAEEPHEKSLQDEFENIIDEETDVPVQEPKAEEKEIPSPIAIDELQEIANEITQSAKEPKDDFPISGVPAYSQAYLDAIRNADEDEAEEAEDLEIEEFDPEAYMEKFKSENKQEEAPENIEEEQPADEPQAEVVPVEEPVRRRYNPNKPKPKYDEAEILREEQRLADEAKKKAQEEQSKEPEEKTEEAAPQPESKPEPEPKEKKKLKQKEEDDALELELDPARFFMSDDKEQETEDEHFIFEQEEPKPEKQPEPSKVVYDYDTSDEKEKNSLVDNPLGSTMSSSSRRIPIWASILIWIVIAGGIFFGAYSFDRYVRNNYENYGNFIYQITDGKVDMTETE
jgi:hypothetical protein